MPELRGDLVVLRSRNVLRQILLLAYREQSVTVYAYHRAVCLDASKSFGYSAPSASCIVTVYRIAEVVI